MNRLSGAFCLIFLMAASLCSVAQCPSNKRQLDIAVSYGIVPADQLAQTIPGETITYNSGATFITARYFMYNRLAFGFSCGIENEKIQFADPRGLAPTTNSAKKITTIAAELYYIYFFRKYLELYTLCGIGPGLATTTAIPDHPVTSGVSETNHQNIFRAQYTPIGVRIGGRLGGFAEAGIGYKGLVCAGLSFKLGPSSWWKE